ncbi:hypothetical protein MN608_08343 [Microdochium nivale]|nr:hypothetical protein MN608_08343 [Microdochium nivale]
MVMSTRRDETIRDLVYKVPSNYRCQTYEITGPSALQSRPRLIPNGGVIRGGLRPWEPSSPENSQPRRLVLFGQHAQTVTSKLKSNRQPSYYIHVMIGQSL